MNSKALFNFGVELSRNLQRRNTMHYTVGNGVESIGPESPEEAHQDDLWSEAEQDPEFIAAIEKKTAKMKIEPYRTLEDDMDEEAAEDKTCGGYGKNRTQVFMDLCENYDESDE